MTRHCNIPLSALLSLVFVLLVLLPTSGHAQIRRLRLSENFSMVERVSTPIVVGSALVLMVAGNDLFGAPLPSMGPPSPGSLDYRISAGFHGDLATGAPLLGGVPDGMAYALTAVPAAWFAASSLSLALWDKPLLGFEDDNFPHVAMGYAQAMGWTALVTNGVKFLVGRPRPYLALDRPAFAWKASEDHLSFFSAHASLSFATATWLYLYASRAISRDIFGDDAMGARHWLMARALPGIVLFGSASVIGISRVYDQRHYASDVLLGATVGTLISLLVYHRHFDERGDPIARWPSSGARTVGLSANPLSLPKASLGSPSMLTFSGVW